MKFLRSVILASAFFFLTITPLFSAAAPGCKNQGTVDESCYGQSPGNRCTGGIGTCKKNADNDGCYCDNTGDKDDGNNNGGGGSTLTNIDAQAKSFFAYQSFDKFIPNLFQIALILGAIAAFAFLIWGGIDYIISGGNQERVKTSKTMIGNALAGLAILATAWVLWRLITYFLGLSPTAGGPFKIDIPAP